MLLRELASALLLLVEWEESLCTRAGGGRAAERGVSDDSHTSTAGTTQVACMLGRLLPSSSLLACGAAALHPLQADRLGLGCRAMHQRTFLLEEAEEPLAEEEEEEAVEDDPGRLSMMEVPAPHSTLTNSSLKPLEGTSSTWLAPCRGQ